MQNSKKLWNPSETGKRLLLSSGVDNACKKYDWQLGELPHGYDHKYTYSNIGYNLKSSDLQASIGISQLEKADSFIEKRNSNFEKLYKYFSEFDQFILPKKHEKSEPS